MYFKENGEEYDLKIEEDIHESGFFLLQLV